VDTAGDVPEGARRFGLVARNAASSDDFAPRALSPLLIGQVAPLGDVADLSSSARRGVARGSRCA
jgi:hypothetical protein